MSDSTVGGDNISGVQFGQALRIWWGTTWRYVVIGMVAGIAFGLVSALAGARFRELLMAQPEDSIVVNVVATAISAIMMIFALRQALLADHHTFSLTVLEEGDAEPGRIHSALGAGRMLRIWWAAAWPLHLLGQGLNYLTMRLGLGGVEAQAGAGPDGAGCLVGFLLAGLMFLLSVACLWRALRKQYGGFRLAALLPWSAQQHV